METTYTIGDNENRVYLNKISNSIRDLNSTTDTTLFVHQMVSLSESLSNFDRNLGNSFPDIDENAQDPTYFIAAILRYKKYSRVNMGISNSKVVN